MNAHVVVQKFYELSGSVAHEVIGEDGTSFLIGELGHSDERLGRRKCTRSRSAASYVVNGNQVDSKKKKREFKTRVNDGQTRRADSWLPRVHILLDDKIASEVPGTPRIRLFLSNFRDNSITVITALCLQSTASSLVIFPHLVIFLATQPVRKQTRSPNLQCPT